MPVATEQCPQGHKIHTAADRDGQGHCRRCQRDRQRQRRVSDGMKLAVARAFEKAGVRFADDDGRPVAPAEVVRQMSDLYAAGALEQL